MNNRWIRGLPLAAVLALAACAPTQQGADATPAPSGAVSPPESTAASPGESADDPGGGDPDDYDY